MIGVNFKQRPVSANKKQGPSFKIHKDKEQLYEECLELKRSLNQYKVENSRLTVKLRSNSKRRRPEENMNHKVSSVAPRNKVSVH